MIDPALNAAILAGINTMQGLGTIPSPCTKIALIGGLMCNNATCRASTEEQIASELGHIILERPVAVGVAMTPQPGYLQADLHALS
jgi:hypothetical protein